MTFLAHTAATETTPETGAGCAVDAFAAAAYEVREITPTTPLMKKFMALHHHVLHHLPAYGRHWVKRRHSSTVRNHLNEGHIALGVFAGKQMVGQVLLTLPDLPGGQNLKGYPLGAGRLAPETCMIVQTLGVHRGHQGRGIRTMLLTRAEEIAQEKGRLHLIAKTDINNTGSVNGFAKAGYAQSAETSVAGEPYKCVFMQKTLAPKVHAVDFRNLPAARATM